MIAGDGLTASGEVSTMDTGGCVGVLPCQTGSAVWKLPAKGSWADEPRGKGAGRGVPPKVYVLDEHCGVCSHTWLQYWGRLNDVCSS